MADDMISDTELDDPGRVSSLLLEYQAWRRGYLDDAPFTPAELSSIIVAAVAHLKRYAALNISDGTDRQQQPTI